MAGIEDLVSGAASWAPTVPGLPDPFGLPNVPGLSGSGTPVAYSSASVGYSIISTLQGGPTAVGLDQTIQGGETPLALDQTIQGGDTPLALTQTIQGGDKDVGASVDVGLDDVNIDVGGTGTPIHTIAELRFPDTFTSETDVDLDVQPVQVDLCIDVGITKLPKARIRQPYESRLALTILGAELVGLTLKGESDVIIDELSSRPHVEPRSPAPESRRPHRHGKSPEVGTTGDGFHIRID